MLAWASQTEDAASLAEGHDLFHIKTVETCRIKLGRTVTHVHDGPCFLSWNISRCIAQPISESPLDLNEGNEF